MDQSRKTILVADDEPFIRRSLEFVLKKEGYLVVSAKDGQEAWDKLKNGTRPEIVFLDVMMPKLTGFELCQKIKSDTQLCKVYVILLTARWQASDREYAETIGADEYITKPFSPSHIIRRVSEILKSKQGVLHE
jgi:two-component system, OmpR family, alkaline phosphatase synthesis response regulator PhoP